jgi:hypothetical protein
MRSQAVVACFLLLYLLACGADRNPDKLRNFKNNKGRGAAAELGAPKLRRVKDNTAFKGTDDDFAALLEQDDDLVRRNCLGMLLRPGYAVQCCRKTDQCIQASSGWENKKDLSLL